MWSMHQQETSSMGHAILEAGMPPFFELGQKPEIWGIPPQWSSHRKQADWGKNLKYGESPPMEQSQEASGLE